LYPSIPVQKINKKKSDNFTLLFIGRDFEMKGGKIALEIIDNITKKYPNTSAIFIAEVPKIIKEKYKKNTRIKIYNLVDQEKLFNEVYPESDVFLYPTFSDTFGFAILEAQSFGLPVIAMKTKSTHTINETINNGKTGYVIENLKSDAFNKYYDAKIINEFIDKISNLIENKNKLKQFKKNAYNEIERGKFSIHKRNKKLSKIYSEAISS
jgi:starch synthase